MTAISPCLLPFPPDFFTLPHSSSHTTHLFTIFSPLAVHCFFWITLWCFLQRFVLLPRANSFPLYPSDMLFCLFICLFSLSLLLLPFLVPLEKKGTLIITDTWHNGMSREDQRCWVWAVRCGVRHTSSQRCSVHTLENVIVPVISQETFCKGMNIVC